MSDSCGVISVEYCELLDADDVTTSKRAKITNFYAGYSFHYAEVK